MTNRDGLDATRVFPGLAPHLNGIRIWNPPPKTPIHPHEILKTQQKESCGPHLQIVQRPPVRSIPQCATAVLTP